MGASFLVMGAYRIVSTDASPLLFNERPVSYAPPHPAPLPLRGRGYRIASLFRLGRYLVGGRVRYAGIARRNSARAWPPAMRKAMSLPQRMNRAPILTYFSMVGWS